MTVSSIMTDDKELDRLFETLSVEYVTRLPERPLIYERGKLRESWWHGPQIGHGHDVLYINKNKKLHRLYGPAYISEMFGVEGWYKDGELHRIDGPAVNCIARPKEYWIGGQKWSPKRYKKEIERRKRKGLI